VLVADDDRATTDALAELLRLEGHEVHVAHDGQEAVDMADRLRPDVIMLDLSMPKLNGVEAGRLIRARSWAASVMLIALTGLGRTEDRAASEAAGFNAHLVKPAEFSRVRELMAGRPT
jgi:CheY-like chemotaxis protein